MSRGEKHPDGVPILDLSIGSVLELARVFDLLLHGGEDPERLPLAPLPKKLEKTDVFVKPKVFERMKTDVDYLLAHPQAKNFVFAKPREALSLLGYVRDEVCK